MFSQILDLLWSDPMAHDGCIPNELRGGGCYWGPDVTRDFLSKHNMQLIVRSHECKQDGYEFCHNRKVTDDSDPDDSDPDLSCHRGGGRRSALSAGLDAIKSVNSSASSLEVQHIALFVLQPFSRRHFF